MRYWDSSALVPLLIREPSTPRARRWLADDPQIATWVWTRVEVMGAVERRLRQGLLSRETRRAVLDSLDDLAAEWHEVSDVLSVRSRAGSLLARHPLRAADAGQLGAALLLRDQIAGEVTFVSLDGRLVTAAEREGLRVLELDPRTDLRRATSAGPSVRGVTRSARGSRRRKRRRRPRRRFRPGSR